MKIYKWNGPGALTGAGKFVKEGEVIPPEIIKNLEVVNEKTKTSTLTDYIKLKSISIVVPEEAATEEEVVKKLSDLTDEEITALSLDELSSVRFTKSELQAKAESVGHETVSGDNKSDFAQTIFDHYNQV